MKISIIIATFNAGKTLHRCLNRITSQLNQETELIIIDGGSTDNTHDIIKSYSSKVNYFISEPDMGIYDAWNKGIKASQGEWIMFLGADDLLKPNALSMYLNKLRSITDTYQLVSSKRTMVNINGKPIYTVGSCWQWPQCIKGMPISHPGALHRRTLFNEVGLYSLKYRICSDYELLLRKKDKLKADFMDEITVDMQTGGMSDSYTAIREYYQILMYTAHISSFEALFRYSVMLVKYTAKHLLKKIGIKHHT